MSDQNAGGIWVVDSEKKAAHVLKRISNGSPVGLDTETVGVDPKEQSPCLKGRVVCWSLAFFDPTLGNHSVTGRPLSRRVFLWADMLPYFTPWLEDPSMPKVGHNIFTFDRHVLLNQGINLQGIVGDTMRLSKLLYSDKRRSHGLKDMMWFNLGYRLGGYQELFSRHKHAVCYKEQLVKGEPVDGKYSWRKVGDQKVKTWVAAGEYCKVYAGKELIPLDTLARDYPHRLEKLYDYASLDTKATLELYPILKEKLEGEPWLT